MIGIPKEGTATVTEVGTAAIITNADSSQQLYVKSISITIGAFSATGTISITDGASLVLIGPILCKDGNGHSMQFVFADEGYPLGKGKSLTLVNATDNVTARATAIAELKG